MQKSISLAIKFKVRQHYECSESMSCIHSAKQLAENTCIICNNKEKIQKNGKSGFHTSAAWSSYARNDLMERLERMLSAEHDLQQHQKCNVSFKCAWNKALEIYEHPKANKMRKVKPFSASVGWFMNFKL